MSNTDVLTTIQAAEAALLTFCRQQGLFGSGQRVLAACSGGADSMAMLCFLLRCRETLGITVGAAHVNHGLRGEAARADADFVERFCRKNGVPFFLFDAAAQGVQIPPGAGETWARRLRYGWFDQLAAEQNACIATAHTLSDQTETVLFRLARGTGLHGLTGIPAVRGVYRRPCLCLTRRETAAYCAALGQDYVQDETNFSDACARNRLRHHAVPAMEDANPAAVQAVGRLCAQMRELDEWLTRQAESLLHHAACGTGYDLAVLRTAPGPVLSAALHGLVGRTRDPEERFVTALRDLVQEGGGAVQLTPQVCWRVKNGILFRDSERTAVPAAPQRLVPGHFVLPGGYSLEFSLQNYEDFLKNSSISKKDYTCWADYAKIGKSIFLRTRQPGDTFRPARRGVGKTLKKYLNEAGVPPQERALLPLLACGSQVVWLWGSGFADGLAPTPETRTLLLVHAEAVQQTNNETGGMYRV